MKNRGLKVLAFIIAVALWILVSGEDQPVRVYNVPLEFTLPKDRLLTGDTPAEVKVRVRGPESVLRSLTAEDLRVPIDLSRAAPGLHSVQALDRGSVRGIPLGLSVESITPDRLTFAVEKKIVREIRLSPRLEGTPAPGYRMHDYQIDPERITLEGSEREVSRISMGYTEPIPLYGRRQSFTTSVGIAIDSTRVRVVESGPITVTVRIEKDETKR